MARVPTQTAEEEALDTLQEHGWTVEKKAGTVHLHGATLKEWKVLPNGMGFDLHFTVPLEEVPNLVELTPFLQRICELEVTRYSRGLRAVEEEDDGVNWKGVDDGE